MNLISKLETEIKTLNLIDKKEIAYYLYIRTGEIFDFNPKWEYGLQQEIEEVLETVFDPENITKYELVCKSWAKLFKKLLWYFGIPSKVVGKIHYKVEWWLEEDPSELYIADLTKCYEDIFGLKFGLPIKHFHKKDTYPIRNIELEKKLGYFKGIKTEEVLLMLYKEIEKMNWEQSEYIDKVSKIIMNIINFPRENVGFISGKEYIEYLFDYFDLKADYCSIFDNTLEIYKAVFVIDNKFLLYEKKNNYFKLSETSKEEIELNLKKFSTIDDYILKRLKKS